MEPVANRAWRARLDALVAPLDAAVNRSLGVVQQGLALAASKGYMSVTFTLPNSGSVRRQSTGNEDLGYYYTVEIGDSQFDTTCHILFGENIDMADARHFYERVNTIVYSNSGVYSGTPPPPPRVTCTPEVAFAYAATFTGVPSAFDDMLRAATVRRDPGACNGALRTAQIYATLHKYHHGGFC
jgi:hypothetical protein